MLAAPADRAYDVVLVDPPYDVPDREVAGWLDHRGGPRLAGARTPRWWSSASARGGSFPWPATLRAVRERRYGDTALHVGRREEDRANGSAGRECPDCYRPGP